MDLQQLATVALSIGLSALGWFARELYQAVNKLRADLSALEVQISREYVRYDRMQDALKPITDQLTRIEDALAHKADK